MSENHDFILWILVLAYALHILEEYFMDWKTWAKKLAQKTVTWTEFYLINACVIIAGICAASVGWRFPAFSLMFPALMLINGVLVHGLPSLIRWRYSPGLVTAGILFLPLGIWVFKAAARDGVLTPRSLIISTLGGALMMLLPLLLQRFKQI